MNITNEDDNLNLNNSEEIPIFIYQLTNTKGDIYLYTKKFKTNNAVYLPCKDPNCIGKAIFVKNEIKVTTQCNICYDNHNYIKIKNAIDKINTKRQQKKI